MSDIVQVRNIGALLNPVAAIASTVLAASLSNGATITGITIDRLRTQGLYQSVDVVALVRSSGSSKYKNKVNLRVQDSPTSTAWTAYGSASGSTLTFGSTSATAKQKVKTAAGVAVDLGAARRYIRVNAVIGWSGTNKSTPSDLNVIAVEGGSDRLS